MASNWAPGLALVTTALILVATAAMPSTAHPPRTTDHGIPAATFSTLWSGDQDTGSTENVGKGTAIEVLANGTDIPLDSPPRAVERWNREDLRGFPATNRSVSIYPPDAALTDGRFIKDAYIEVFAVQPSTHARLSPSRQPLYVAPNGSALGTVDYRIELPANDTAGDRRVFWSLEEHRINETRLLVDGDTETTANGTHTPALEYSSLDGYAGETQTLTLEAEIWVTLEKHVRTKHRHCRTVNNSTTCTTEWHDAYSYPAETVTVSDSISVTEYDLAVSGFIARYPNGDLGLVVYKNQPWLGYSLPNGDVRGVWRFYSARDKNWDTLVYHTESGKQTVHSPLHPLQVNAYPIETGPTPSPRENVTILAVYGRSTDPPTLPPNVHLDVLTNPYTASYGIAIRSQTNANLATVHAWGLVRGVDANRPPEEFARVQIHRSNLTLTVRNTTNNTVTVQVQLRDAQTGVPINTTARDGYIVLNGQRVETTGNGTVTATLDRPPGSVSARYEPGQWWRNLPGYTGDSDTVLVQGTILHVVAIVYRIGVPVSLFLLGVFIIDRFTGWQIWPLWRGL